VNGVALGAEPAPLLHGDRIEVAGRQLRFSDDRKAGSTVVMPAFGTPKASTAVATRGRAGVLGGRLVSLVDGREYVVPAGGMRIGRDADCDIVVIDDSVSDSHAKIQRRDSAWYVVDVGSRNGTYVAGRRVSSEQQLGATAAVRFGGVKVIFRSEPEVIDADGGTRVIVGFRPTDQLRARTARPIVATRQSQASDSTASAKQKTSPLVWIAAAVVIGATVLLVIQDR
jgi:hypothetical protein